MKNLSLRGRFAWPMYRSCVGGFKIQLKLGLFGFEFYKSYVDLYGNLNNGFLFFNLCRTIQLGSDMSAYPFLYSNVRISQVVK